MKPDIANECGEAERALGIEYVVLVAGCISDNNNSSMMLIGDIYRCDLGFPGGSAGKESACKAGHPGSIPGWERSPGEGNGNSLYILAWKISWTEEPGGLHSMGS